MRFQAPRGTEDVLPGESYRWQWLEEQFQAHTALYGYREIRTPTFEDTELFVRTSGETSEVVSKQMYEFVDKGGRQITLKPEGTAPVMRAVIEHNLCPPGTTQRLWYATPFFRHERPQKGRLREAHQFGLELVGSPSPLADAEIIEVTVRFFERLGLTGLHVLLNSIGRSECRSRYRQTILEHLGPYLESLDEEPRANALKNPLRLLDSKDPEVQARLTSLPPIYDFLEDQSRANLDELQRILTLQQVPFQLAPNIVRGLDYYTDTVFEVQSSSLGAQSALCGGGRYDGLIKEIGGPPTPAVGVGIGIERLLIVLEAQGMLPEEPPPDVYLVSAGEAARDHVLRLASELRRGGLRVLVDLDFRSLKSQLRQADKSCARFAVILGDEELEAGVVTTRDLKTADQRRVPRDAVLSELIGSCR